MLDIQDLHLTISKLHILKGINLKVYQGETVGVIGPNGSGKTTLFNSISGFAHNDVGKIIYQGKDIMSLPAYKRARLGIGRVFQNFGIFREMTVLENMLIALESHQSFIKNLFPFSKSSQINKRKAEVLLKKVNLSEKANQKAASLSGGQMRLLEIIRAVAFGADFLLLDEPTAGVSPKMKSEISAMIRKLQKRKKTIMIIEHDINFIQSFCDRIVVLDSGKVVLDGTPEEVRNNHKLQEIYFGEN